MIRRAILKAVAVPGYQVPFGGREMPLPYGWGTGGIQVTAAIIGQDDTLKVIDQGADDTTNAVSIRRFFAKVADVATTTSTEEATIIQTRHRVPETPLREGQILVFQVPIPEPLRMLEPRETETRTLHALSEYGVMQVSLYESIARHGRIAKTYNYPVMVNGRYIMSPSPIPKFDNPKLDRSPALQLYGAGREKRIYAVPPHTPVKSLDFDDHPFEVESWTRVLRALRLAREFSRRDDRRRCRQADVHLLRHRLVRAAAMSGPRLSAPILSSRGLTKRFGDRIACRDVDFDLWPGEVLGVVGESGSGKTTLLNCLAGRLTPEAGSITYDSAAYGPVDVHGLSEARRRLLSRTEWGFVNQDARDGLRMGVSAGANIGERLMAVGARHYGDIRRSAADWLGRVEIEHDRLDDRPTTYSGGMRQRLQIARNLVSEPRLVFMDEPTGGLDVSVQARILDLLRGLVGTLNLSAVLVTHDLGVARLLTHRLMVMQGGRVVEDGLTDQVLDDPQHAYTQMLVASILPV